MMMTYRTLNVMLMALLAGAVVMAPVWGEGMMHQKDTPNTNTSARGMQNVNDTTMPGQRWGNSLESVIPAEEHAYTYYPQANVYYAPTTRMYYYPYNNGWVSASNAPNGVKLDGTPRTVRLRGVKPITQ